VKFIGIQVKKIEKIPKIDGRETEERPKKDREKIVEKPVNDQKRSPKIVERLKKDRKISILR
jgi:hypothetical protein